ncbi:hypothetical protein PSACC_03645, partial [Paramicrosporidium saccamoebae]
MSSSEKRQRVAPLGEPRVWVFSMEPEDLGLPLYEEQTIGSAVEELMKDPNVGVALPRIATPTFGFSIHLSIAARM